MRRFCYIIVLYNVLRGKVVRLDKFLKVSRIIKRRTVANEACDTGHISVNGKVAKPGYELKIGDIIELRFGQRRSEYEVLALSEHVLKADAAGMYREIQK